MMMRISKLWLSISIFIGANMQAMDVSENVREEIPEEIWHSIAWYRIVASARDIQPADGIKKGKERLAYLLNMRTCCKKICERLSYDGIFSSFFSADELTGLFGVILEQVPLKIARIMIAHGADVNRQDQNDSGMTLLHRMVIANRPPMVKKLVKLGAKKDIKDKDGHTPIDCSWVSQRDIRRLLMGN